MAKQSSITNVDRGSDSDCPASQSFKVTLLGTGSPQPRMDRFGPSILVEAGEQKLLFDCGRGAAQRISDEL